MRFKRKYNNTLRKHNTNGLKNRCPYSASLSTYKHPAHPLDSPVKRRGTFSILPPSLSSYFSVGFVSIWLYLVSYDLQNVCINFSALQWPVVEVNNPTARRLIRS